MITEIKLVQIPCEICGGRGSRLTPEAAIQEHTELWAYEIRAWIFDWENLRDLERFTGDWAPCSACDGTGWMGVEDAEVAV